MNYPDSEECHHADKLEKSPQITSTVAGEALLLCLFIRTKHMALMTAQDTFDVNFSGLPRFGLKSAGRTMGHPGSERARRHNAKVNPAVLVAPNSFYPVRPEDTEHQDPSVASSDPGNFHGGVMTTSP
ncbi:MAG TPA: hypothetical protein VGM27_34185 [Acidobacteriaceae bacterium]